MSVVKSSLSCLIDGLFGVGEHSRHKKRRSRIRIHSTEFHMGFLQELLIAADIEWGLVELPDLQRLQIFGYTWVRIVCCGVMELLDCCGRETDRWSGA